MLAFLLRLAYSSQLETALISRGLEIFGFLTISLSQVFRQILRKPRQTYVFWQLPKTLNKKHK
ncbi:MAG: hypothetical protein EAZ86_12225 [Oscillatoriales cyanobacterium]|nr:MAG: hypothetical protein EAZ86_12225 [Oscillatoriales cyanobacterium]